MSDVSVGTREKRDREGREGREGRYIWMIFSP